MKNINLDTFNENQLDTLEKLLYLDKAKEKLSSAINKQNFDYESRKELFLKSFPAENTRKIYAKAFSILENYLKENGLTVLDMTAENIDRFILSLETLPGKPSQGTKRLYISALSSFFSRLERYGLISRNNFHGSKLPKPKRGRDIKIMTEDDFKKVLQTFTAGSGRGNVKRTPETMEKWKVIFELLRETGLRISAVKTLKISEKGLISYYSKGKEGRAFISAELSRKLRGLDLADITEASIQKALQTASKRAGISVFNPHSIRHLYASDYYKKTKDIYALKGLLNHSSISVTENYLKSLNVI
ncbi:MAG: tyrosine-type recombinase/integrase [Bacteroidales bacterium]